jgi:hypothetical protein
MRLTSDVNFINQVLHTIQTIRGKAFMKTLLSLISCVIIIFLVGCIDNPISSQMASKSTPEKTATTFTTSYQTSWAWCSKCQGLFYSPNLSSSHCPAGGQHALVSSGATNYGPCVSFSHPIPGNFQEYWRWCNKCQGMFYGLQAASSVCPMGGTHQVNGTNYGFMATTNDGLLGSPVQGQWRFCDKCKGMHYGPNSSSSVCPAGGHHNVASAEYFIKLFGTIN